MTTLQKFFAVCLRGCFAVMFSFFAVMLFLSYERNHDGVFNTPKYHDLASYQQDGGKVLDYYLGYTLLEGYDTQTEPDDEGMVSRTPAAMQNTLYTIIVIGLLVILSFTAWVCITEATTMKTVIIGYLSSIALILISIQFISYFLKEGISLL